jgi:hypothetical protein
MSSNDEDTPNEGVITVFSKDEVTHEIDVASIVDSGGIPLIEMSMEASADTQKIDISELDNAMMIDQAFLAGELSGFLHGQQRILKIIYDILLRTSNTQNETWEIILTICKHANIKPDLIINAI